MASPWDDAVRKADEDPVEDDPLCFIPEKAGYEKAAAKKPTEAAGKAAPKKAAETDDVAPKKAAGSSHHVSGDVAKALALFVWPNGESATTPDECNALHQRMQASLLQLEPSELRRLLNALSVHHHKNYPIKREQTYQELAKRLAAWRVQAAEPDVLLSVHGAARGDLGVLVKTMMPDADVIQSDLVSGQSQDVDVTGVSDLGYPLLPDGQPAPAGSRNAVLARNCFYSWALSFTMLRAMVDLLKEGGFFGIAFVRTQAVNVAAFLLEAIDKGVLVDAQLHSVSLKEGSTIQTAFVFEARRGAAPVEKLDAMDYYSFEKLLGGDESLLGGLAFAREVEQLKREAGERLHPFGTLSAAWRLITVGELMLRYGDALSRLDRGLLDGRLEEEMLPAGGLHQMLALHRVSLRSELGWHAACARSLQARREAHARLVAQEAPVEEQLDALVESARSLSEFFGDLSDPKAILDKLEAAGIYMALVNGQLKIGVGTNGTGGRVRAQGKDVDHVTIALFFKSFFGKKAGGKRDTTGIVTFIVEALEALLTIEWGGLGEASSMYGSPGSTCCYCTRAVERAIAVRAARALVDRLGGSLRASSLMSARLQRRVKLALEESDKAVARLQAAEAKLDRLGVVEGVEADAIDAEAAEEAEAEAMQARAAVEVTEMGLQDLRLELEQRARKADGGDLDAGTIGHSKTGWAALAEADVAEAAAESEEDKQDVQRKRQTIVQQVTIAKGGSLARGSIGSSKTGWAALAEADVAEAAAESEEDKQDVQRKRQKIVQQVSDCQNKLAATQHQNKSAAKQVITDIKTPGSDANTKFIKMLNERVRLADIATKFHIARSTVTLLCKELAVPSGGGAKRPCSGVRGVAPGELELSERAIVIEQARRQPAGAPPTWSVIAQELRRLHPALFGDGAPRMPKGGISRQAVRNICVRAAAGHASPTSHE